MARSSVSAYSASGPAPARWAASSASRSSSRASVRRLRRRSMAPRSARARALPTWRRRARTRRWPHGAGTLHGHRRPRRRRHAAPRRARAGAERLGEQKLLFCQAFRRFVIAEREMGERGVRSPGDVTRRGHHRTRQAFPNAEEVPEPFGDASWPTRSRPRARRRGAAVTIPLSTSESSGASARSAASSARPARRAPSVAHRRS